MYKVNSTKSTNTKVYELKRLMFGLKLDLYDKNNLQIYSR